MTFIYRLPRPRDLPDSGYLGLQALQRPAMGLTERIRAPPTPAIPPCISRSRLSEKYNSRHGLTGLPF